MDRISLVPPELYGNIGYTNSIIERIPLSIELTTNDGLELNDQSGDGYKIDLGDVINIDRVTDLFLDSFISYKTRAMGAGSETYILGVKEFDIKTLSNSSPLKNKILIPNTSEGSDKSTLHRASKFNYIGTITPKKLKELTITLTDNSDPPRTIGNNIASKVWINFILIPREK